MVETFLGHVQQHDKIHNYCTHQLHSTVLAILLHYMISFFAYSHTCTLACGEPAPYSYIRVTYVPVGTILSARLLSIVIRFTHAPW